MSAIVTARSDFAISVDVRGVALRAQHPLIFSTFRNLAVNQSMELVDDHDPRPLYAQLQVEMPGGFTWNYFEWGPQIWRIRIGRLATWWADGQCCGTCAAV